MLFTDHQINYNTLPAIFRRGTIFIRMVETDIVEPVEDNQEEKKTSEFKEPEVDIKLEEKEPL